MPRRLPDLLTREGASCPVGCVRCLAVIGEARGARNRWTGFCIPSRARISRRNLLGTVAIGGAGAALISAAPGAIARQQPGEESVGQASVPAWTFVIHAVQDPYDGELQRPQEPDPDFRYLGVDVEIRNESEAALNVTANNAHLLDDDGNEHTSGAVRGEESALTNVNLLPGEHARLGVVWCSCRHRCCRHRICGTTPAPGRAASRSHRERTPRRDASILGRCAQPVMDD